MTQYIKTTLASDPLAEYERLANDLYNNRQTVTPDNAFEAFQRLNKQAVTLREAIPALIGMVRERDESLAKLIDDLVWYEERNTKLTTDAEDAEARATAAEARVKELETALDKIVRGRYDGLEVTHYSAVECRNIARAALGRQA